MADQLDLLAEENNVLFHSLRQKVVDDFFVYHRKYPWVYPLFKRFADDIRKAGHDKYGAKAIIERIRWHVDIDNPERVEEFKISNNHAACYARLLMIHDESFKYFFDIYTSAGTVVER